MIIILSGLDEICERIRQHFDRQDTAREKAYNLSRQVVRNASTTIKSIHRQEIDQARQLLDETARLTSEMLAALGDTPALRYGGFVGDAEKEYAEAAITLAVITREALPTPEELRIDYAPWLNGLGEAGGEFRRHILDLIRQDELDRAEQFLSVMDETYHTMIGFDYPNAISQGLRRRGDALRGMVERTRGDLTNALRQARLEQRLAEFDEKLK